MITQETADYLVSLPKKLIEGEVLLDKKNYSPSIPVDDRLFMASEVDREVSFFLEISQSAKKLLKLTLHFQEQEASIPLY